MPNPRLVQPMAPFQLVTELTASRVPSGVEQALFAIRSFNTFWVYITPFLGGFVAGCYLGRYKTILYFSLVCLSERFALG